MFETLATAVPFSVAAPDLPGHGSTTTPVALDPTVAAISRLLQTTGPGPLLGYSQGGRIALTVAAVHPHLVTALIVVSATPGLSGEAQEVRREADEVLASHIVDIGVDSFLRDWLEDPLVGTVHLTPEQRNRDSSYRAVNTAAGLAAALRGLGQGAVPAVEPRSLGMPVLWVSGSRDEKYTTLAATAAASSGQLHVTVDAGHNVVAAAPHQLGVVVTDFLNRSGVTGGVRP